MQTDTVDFWSLFAPLPRQVTFLQQAKRKRYMLYGGARGGGKSMLLRWGSLWRLLDWAMRGMTGVRVGLFSEDYPTLKDRQITKIRKEFPGWLGEIKATQEEGLGFFLHEQYGDGAILLRNLDDPSKYQSAEFAGVAVEELTKSPIDVFDVLRGSLRWPGIEDSYFWGATNPGGIGHLWVKALWVDREYSGDMERFEGVADEFCFVKSLPADNPHLSDSYWQDLKSLPTGLFKAWVEGSWDAFEGQAFPEWDRDVHVAAYEPPRFDGTWTAGGDFGSTAPGGIWTMYSDSERHLVRHEYYFRQTDPYSVGRRWGEMLLVAGINVLWAAIDAPAVQVGYPTILEEIGRGLRDAFGPGVQVPALVAPPKGHGSRIVKKQLLHDYLRVPEWKPRKEGEQRPMWAYPKLQIHPSCKNLIRTLPALPLDEKKIEDVDTNAEDHPYDGLTAWLMSRTPAVERKERRKRDPDSMADITNPLPQTPWQEHEQRGPRVSLTRVPEGWR